MNKTVKQVTANLIERSRESRAEFLERSRSQSALGKNRAGLSCGNLAHAVATSCNKETILNLVNSNVAIISAYNDMVSAHEPYRNYPEIIKATLAELGHSAQVAGGVPAMCDGITQGQDGMDISLFSRDLIAQATAVSLSHNVYDSTLLLGVCDKIAPAMLMGAMSFAHLPTAFVPVGLMATGISNEEKTSVRQKYLAKEVGIDTLQKMECSAYHSHGTCTFYGTANTNQLVFEAMGLMLPGSAFVSPDSELRNKLTKEVAVRVASSTLGSSNYRPLHDVMTEKNIINGIVALLASGGSTNHTIHMVAIARSAGILLNWDDISELSSAVPLLVNVYPNGSEDMNEFHRSGAVPALLKRLNEDGFLNRDVLTSFGEFEDQLKTPHIDNDRLCWSDSKGTTNGDVIALSGECFQDTGGIKVLNGNIGRCVIKVSAIAEEFRKVEAQAKVFTSQHDVEAAYQAGELNQDCIVVVTHNGAASNGMPELHKLMPILANVQKAGFKVALITDGRLSGASGKVPSAIHMSPDAARGGAIALIRDGDILSLDCVAGTVNNLSDVSGRECAEVDTESQQLTFGRNLFTLARNNVSSAEEGASFIL
ncbi:phosphogluconate dehydratase [Vibrio ezurae]|uniref:Phosphogluconate dehydratase n=1 Tax=Vibrio ezurae NBRC 102218 TaxID=1219080 RepID=U3B344_9VIBR|nr:phosphogluconate dehydratase [Vibrio ezurae]GAD80355.1 phosphogluconate dehydratase [Vibrio ezurae NBRC 102218]